MDCKFLEWCIIHHLRMIECKVVRLGLTFAPYVWFVHSICPSQQLLNHLQRQQTMHATFLQRLFHSKPF